MKQVKFIHAADLHLDSPFKGMEMNVAQSVWERMKQSTFESFERIVDKAIQERVDFVLQLLASIYGFSYLQQAVTDNMTAQYTKMSDAPFHIGMLHGSVEGCRA